MNQKKYFKLATAIGIVLLIIAYYLGHMIDGCDSDAQRRGYFIGAPLLIIFIGLIFSAQLGTTTKSKIIYTIAKIVFLLFFLAVLFYLSFTLCF